MNREIIIPWLLQLSPIWMALVVGFVPALIAGFKRRPMTRWYLYGFVCALVAWPLVAVPTIHALLLRPRGMPEQVRQRQRRADALALLAESSVRSYPSWVAELRRKSPAGIDRRHYAYQHIGPGDALELIREPANRSDDHAVAYYHRGVHLGYVPKRHRWIAEALDDGLRLAAIAEEVKIGWIFRRRAKFVGTRIVVLYDGH
jgi:hypothetical protein